MYKRISLIALSICIFSSIAVGQVDQPPPPIPLPPPPPIPERISGGVLNGKAISLPKPVYPAAAQAAKISGSVSVAVIISKSGSIMSASATSGHPLLRNAAVSAARLAQFATTYLSGKPVEVSGVLVYKFGDDDDSGDAADSDNLNGSDENVDNSGNLNADTYENTELTVTEEYIPPSQEKGLKQLKDFPVLATSILLSAFEYMGNEKEFKPVLLDFIKKTPQLEKKSETLGNFGDKSFKDQKAIVAELQNVLRQTPDSSENWQYQMGEVVGQMMGQFGNFERDLKPIKEQELEDLLKKIGDLSYSSPVGFPENILEKFVKVSQFADREDLGNKDVQKEIFEIISDSF